MRHVISVSTSDERTRSLVMSVLHNLQMHHPDAHHTKMLYCCESTPEPTGKPTIGDGACEHPVEKLKIVEHATMQNGWRPRIRCTDCGSEF